MAKPGKPNSFVKGMNADAEESLQPKQTYRYAKNARVTSFDGDNVSLQPYPSDRKAIDFQSEISYQSNVTSLSNQSSWGLGGYTFGPDDIYPQILSGQTIPANSIAIGEGENNLQGYFFEANITITTNSGNEYIIETSLMDSMLNGDYIDTTPDIDQIIANAINSDDSIPITAFVYHNSNADNYELGTDTDEVTWSFVNNANPDDYVTNFSVNIEGNASVQYVNVYDWVAPIIVDFLAGLGIPEENILNQYNYFISTIANNISNYMSDFSNTFGGNMLNINPSIINFSELNPTVQGILVNNYTDIIESGLIPENWGLQILGTYPFSDYMILLAHWPALSIITGTPDLVLKVYQQPDGQLSGSNVVNPDPVMNLLTEQIMGITNYTVYFTGNLGFSPKKKLKVVGSEENEITRRIYFTDTEFPLRSMNVALEPDVYTPWVFTPEYFNLFSPSIFNVPKVTGFKEGGALDSIAYSYCYRYKTVDGRVSQISPLSNPASVPVTQSTEISAFTQGNEPGNNSGKSMKGIIENLDIRFSKIQMIAVPYIDANTPAGSPIVFNEYMIPDVVNGQNTINWIHTGTEASLEEISIVDFNINQINWDTCKALETKDNRLFCGNLNNTSITISTDFTVASYNIKNEPHNYETGNPNLHHDLMYSRGGIDYAYNSVITPTENEGTSRTYATDYGPHFHYKYIKGPGQEGEIGSAYFDGATYAEDYIAPEDFPEQYNNTRRGIFGAQSRYFDEPNPDLGEEEGVRVTFRIKTDEEMLRMDSQLQGNLINTIDGISAKAPFDNVIAGGGFYHNYANPLHNSNHVGYRRGEVYRFGLLFYDRKGSPLFVKRIGDIRMPEHSTEYILPIYDNDNSSQINEFYQPYPYYYQTSRSQIDHGFKRSGMRQYRNTGDWEGQGIKTCVLYPYFEVKVSSETAKKVGGYSIVRVPRTDENKSIITSGIIGRAEYVANELEDDVDNDVENVKDKFVNPSFSLFTPILQTKYNAFASGGGFVGEESESDWEKTKYYGFRESSSNVFCLDSPDAILNEDFVYLSSSSDRLKLVESAYCFKQNISQFNDDGDAYGAGNQNIYMNMELADQYYHGATGGITGIGNVFTELGVMSFLGNFGQSGGLYQFAAVLQKNLLSGGTVTMFNDTYEAGAWEYQFSNQAPSGNYANLYMHYATDVLGQTGVISFDGGVINNDSKKIGFYTKYYSKRISCYPQYSLGNATFDAPQGNSLINVTYNNDDTWNTQVPYFFPNGSKKAQGLPFGELQSDNEDSSPTSVHSDITENVQGGNVDDYFPQSTIKYARVVGAGEEVFADLLGSSKNYINGSVYQDITMPEIFSVYSLGLDGVDGQSTNGYMSKNVYNLNAKTIVVALNDASQLPITRQQIWGYNYPETVHKGIGAATEAISGNGGRSTYSPEVTVAQLTRLQSLDTMYGGYTPGAFSRNTFQSIGHFTPVGDFQNQVFGESQSDVGKNGNHVFGGDTFIGLFDHKKTFKDGTNDKSTCFTYQVPIESDVNLDLRHGMFFGSNEQKIPREQEDEYRYNEAYHTGQNILSFMTRPPDFREVFEWPSTIAWSEQKFTGEYSDSYSVFPINQFKDIDYVRGPITQMFVLKDNLFALQDSGVCKLSVNPRVLIKTKEGQDIEAATGSGAALERYDYVSQQYGSQHFHGRAETDSSVYFYDDSNCKFLSLGLRPKDGGFTVNSLGDAAGMQSYFDSYKNMVINDSPLTNRVYNVPASDNYNQQFNEMYNTLGDGFGGISIGHDPEYSEILLTLKAEGRAPETIVYNELLGAFTSFISKRAADYFKFKGRLYCTYDSDINPLSSIYLSNGYQNDYDNFDFFQEIGIHRYLNFGGIDYYIWDYDGFMDENSFEMSEGVMTGPWNYFYPEDGNDTIPFSVHKEPFEVELVFNDEPFQSKLFDKIQIMMNSDTDEGSRYIYFRKFVFKGAANRRDIVEFDRDLESYASTDNLEPGNRKSWYTVKDAMHYVPMRRLGRSLNQGNLENTVRGNYAKVKMTLGWKENGIINENEDSEYGSIKSEKFNIFSIIPFYRYSRI